MTLNLLAVGGLLLADSCVYVSPNRFLLPALLGIGFEVLLWVNVLMCISWLFSQRKSWCVVGLIAVVLSAGNILATYSHERADKEEKEHRLTVLTYNTHQSSQMKKAERNEVLQYVKTSGADVVCLQEYEVRKDPYYLTFEEAKRYLKKEYPYTYYDFRVHNKKRQYGLAVYSKYPLVNKTTIEYETRGNLSNYCDVVVGEDTLRLFNNHLESNSFSQSELEMQDGMGSTEELKRSTLRIVKKMVAAYRYRAKEAEVVRAEMDRSPYPMIVAGDMNDVPVSYTYRTLAKGMEDTWLHASVGKHGWTFMRKMLGVRIDYVLVSEGLTTREARVDQTAHGSDHYPYICTVQW